MSVPLTKGSLNSRSGETSAHLCSQHTTASHQGKQQSVPFCSLLADFDPATKVSKSAQFLASSRTDTVEKRPDEWWRRLLRSTAKSALSLIDRGNCACGVRPVGSRF